MDFKLGDIVICIDDTLKPNHSSLTFGEAYVVAGFSAVSEHVVRVKPKKYMNYTNYTSYAWISKIKLIHENDWVRRLKYGV